MFVCVFVWRWLRGCGGLTGTSLVTPTGETRTNSLLLVFGGPETETRALQSHSDYLKAETHTGLFCATPRAFCILMQPHLLPPVFFLSFFLFQASCRITHTQRKKPDSSSSSSSSPQRERDASVRVVQMWQTCKHLSKCVLLLLLFFFLAREENQILEKSQASAMQLLQGVFYSLRSVEKLHCADNPIRNIFKRTISHMILELKSLFALMTPLYDAAE